MPTYTYSCSKCNHEFEVFKAMGTSDSQIKCPRCGGGVERVFLSFNYKTGCSSNSGSAFS